MPSQPHVPMPRDDVKERVREALDIVDVAGSYISLRRQGKVMTGLCPWHEDSRPSLQINPDRQTYRCWVCDVGGDVFSFVMRMEKVEFREALEQLADRAGISLPRGRGGLPVDDKAALRAMMAWATERFRDCLRAAPEAAPARDYLRGRGVSADTIERFDLGFAPPAWDWLLRQAAAAGMSRDALVKAGLAIERDDRSGHYDRFRGRVIFPIRDPQGRCVAFGGRVLPGDRPDSAKYINSPETPLFSKSAIVTFGGAYAVLGYIAQQAVDRYGWITAGDMAVGLGLAETTPGPLIMVVEFVGFLAAYSNPGSLPPLVAGTLGAVITVWVTFVPCFMFIFLGAPYVEKLRHNQSIVNALTAVGASVAGVVLNLAVWFALHTAFDTVTEKTFGPISIAVPDLSTVNLSAIVIALIAAVFIFRLRIGILKVLGVCAVLGAAAALLGFS